MARRTRFYREVFFAHNGPGPYQCFFCGKPVTFTKVTIHHKDEDSNNNRLRNLAPSHHGCHIGHHKRGKKLRETQRSRISAALTGKPKSLEHRRRIGVATIGNTRGLGYRHTSEAKAAISAARRRV